MVRLNLPIRIFTVLVLCALMPIVVSAQTFRTLVKFDGSNGAFPDYIIQGTDGRLWGTTQGSNDNCGTVFNMTPTGVLTTVFTFNCSNGENPQDIIQAVDGNFYGVTFSGGDGNRGTVFKLSPTGSLTTLYNFESNGSSGPVGITQGIDGSFYGATYGGGLYGWGTLFKITSTGDFTELYDFDFTHGAQPYAGPTAGVDGNFYGTTYGGVEDGTVYKITPKGALTVLYSFGELSSDGSFPVTPLIQAIDGAFYGSTPDGGSGNDGTVFKITPRGVFTTMHAFNETDGRQPGILMLATDTKLYGGVVYGGMNDNGIVFAMRSDGTVSTVHSFNGSDGSSPIMLVQDTSGNLYGVTDGGGDLNCDPTYGCGTIFGLGLGLGPFVKSLPGAGRVGAKVAILGNGLTGTTSVMFDGVPAQFMVSTPSLILSRVPAAAKTGKIEVVLSGHTLSSNVPFLVIP